MKIKLRETASYALKNAEEPNDEELEIWKRDNNRSKIPKNILD